MKLVRLWRLGELGAENDLSPSGDVLLLELVLTVCLLSVSLNVIKAMPDVVLDCLLCVGTLAIAGRDSYRASYMFGDGDLELSLLGDDGCGWF